MKTDTPPTRLEDYRAPDFLIDRVGLDFRLDPTATLVVTKLSLRRRAGNGALNLVADQIRLRGLSLNDTPLADDQYEVTPERLAIHSPPEEPFMLEIETELDPSANTELMGLYRSNGTYCTQCEAEGFRRITYFLDRPDVLAVYTTRIEAPRDAAPVLLSNGNLVEAGEVPGTDRHYAIWCDPFPKPSYLFALVAGDLAAVEDAFTTASGRNVRLAIHCEHGKERRCRYAMDSLKRAMRWDEEMFGREYDLDVFNIVAVSDFNMGAMENKGLNVFNDRFILADSETATDLDYGHIEGVVAHEYFHNWTGNRITCRDWFQLCLKEGLTVFRDQEFSADMVSRAVRRIDDVRTLKARQFPEDSGPLAHPVPTGGLSRDQQFLHGDRLRERRGACAECSVPCLAPTRSEEGWTYISSAMMARPRRLKTSSLPSPIPAKLNSVNSNSGTHRPARRRSWPRAPMIRLRVGMR